MDHEFHPYYSDRKPDYEPSLANAFLNVVEILRGLIAREPERFPVR